MFRTQDNVPNVYVDFSRDFQLLCRLIDFVQNSTKESIDSIKRLTDTKHIQSNALELLKTKLGFFSNHNFLDKELRYILRAFPVIIKNKGSVLGINQSINAWCNINGYNGKFSVIITNKQNGSNVYEINIRFTKNSFLKYDMTSLEEILKFIIPTGYTIRYSIFSEDMFGEASNPEATIYSEKLSYPYYNYTNENITVSANNYNSTMLYGTTSSLPQYAVDTVRLDTNFDPDEE